MKDGNLHRVVENQQKRMLTMYRQLLFLDSRMQAFETILNSQFSMLKALWNPKSLKNAVDDLQMQLIKQHDEQMEKMRAQAKQEAMKPKIEIVNGLSRTGMGIIAICFLLLGCVPAKTHRIELAQARKDGYSEADKECVVMQAKLGNYISSLKDRLARFNQLDTKGNLRPLNTWNGDTDSGEVTGAESWQK